MFYSRYQFSLINQRHKFFFALFLNKTTNIFPRYRKYFEQMGKAVCFETFTNSKKYLHQKFMTRASDEDFAIKIKFHFYPLSHFWNWNPHPLNLRYVNFDVVIFRQLIGAGEHTVLECKDGIVETLLTAIVFNSKQVCHRAFDYGAGNGRKKTTGVHQTAMLTYWKRLFLEMAYRIA